MGWIEEITKLPKTWTEILIGLFFTYFSSSYLIVFFVYRDLFIQIGSVKLILLVFCIPTPLFLGNTILVASHLVLDEKKDPEDDDFDPTMIMLGGMLTGFELYIILIISSFFGFSSFFFILVLFIGSIATIIFGTKQLIEANKKLEDKKSSKDKS